jgi:hypothetical protein
MRGAIAVVVALASLVSTRAQASALYSIDINSRVYQVSQSNGMATTFATAWPPGGTRDLASDTRPASYRLWTTNSTGELVSINAATGEGTVVGRFFPTAGVAMRTVAFDIASGKLYGGGDGTSAQLFEINPQTAAATLVGNTGRNLGGLGADLAGNLFGVVESTGEIYQLDKLTGASTLVTTVPVQSISDLAFRPEDGQLFAISQFGPIATQKSLYTVDLVSGNATRLGALEPGTSFLPMNGLAFGPGTYVPEPGLVGLLALGAMVLMQRRRYSAGPKRG